MNRVLSLTLIVSLSLLLGGCPKKPTTVPPSTTGETVGSTAGTTRGAGSNDAGQGSQLPGAGGPRGSTDGGLRTMGKIYFDFDSSEIKPEYRSLIADQGKWLGTHRSLHVRLEGNTDERGSAEYNVALGERRAQAVKGALLLQDAVDTQLTTVSYGAERPVAEGHTEVAWAQNRRVDLVYLGDH